MVHRPLGDSGLLVSPIGFGAFKIGRNVAVKYPQPYDLPDEPAVARLLEGVLDLGINYIDTAPAYGLGEERLGRVLGPRRADLVLSTKVGEQFEGGRSRYDFSRRAVRESVQGSLARLRTDYVDLLLIHAGGDDDDLGILRQTDVVEALLELRGQGFARAIGLSGKTVQGARAALPWADVLMVEYHMLDPSHGPVIAEAAEAGVGVVVKKGLASGRLDAAAAIEFVLSNRAVGSLVVGGLSLDHLRLDVEVAARVTES